MQGWQEAPGKSITLLSCEVINGLYARGLRPWVFMELTLPTLRGELCHWVPGLPLVPVPIQQWVRRAPSMSWLTHALWWGHRFNGILAAAQD